jgi:ubiquinone/menaquinone biosynthesis C-methylase UbiE
MMRQARGIQEDYYSRLAAEYDAMHGADSEHHVALAYISSFLGLLAASSVLDVGCGTGRGIKHFAAAHPDVRVVGVEPVDALIKQAVVTGVDASSIVLGHGEQLPFPDKSFDVVCEFGVLHHVRRPNDVVREMLRVARRGVFLSDTNRFGHGSTGSRLAKLALARSHLWPVANYLKTKGRGYRLSAADGLSYSYSVYDSLELLERWAKRVVLIPTGSEVAAGWLHPLLTTNHVLACALRDGEVLATSM